MKSKIAQHLSYNFLKNFGSKLVSPQQINCENFIIGYMVGFQAILDQRQVFTTLDENWIAHALNYLSACSCETIYPVQESKSKLELFYRMFITFFWPQAWIQFWKEFETIATCTKEIWGLSSAEVIFLTSWGYLCHFCMHDKYWRVAGYCSACY